ncbi:hypothetical protein FACS189454_03900 [Planctomycetales bacterium]|nr:hypothetical protein FACS189454_03900 [Planctomycetales bacterium]
MLYILLVSTAVSYSVFFTASFELNRRQHEAALRHIHFLQDCLEQYKNENGTYPDKLLKLFDENASEQFQSICHDVWGNSFLYEPDGKIWLLISQGKDGMIEGVGVDSDIFIHSTTVRFNEKRKEIQLKASPTFWQNFILSTKYILVSIFIGIVSLFSMILSLLQVVL